MMQHIYVYKHKHTRTHTVSVCLCLYICINMCLHQVFFFTYSRLKNPFSFHHCLLRITQAQDLDTLYRQLGYSTIIKDYISSDTDCFYIKPNVKLIVRT